MSGDTQRQTYLVQITSGSLLRILFTNTQYPARGHRNVVEHCHVAPQVEMLKHHRKPCAQTLKFICVGHMHAVAVMPHPDQLVIQAHGTVVGRFQKVDTTQEGTLA
ncbi:hypothetical protein D3C81_1287600 [compost metagenome]